MPKESAAPRRAYSSFTIVSWDGDVRQGLVTVPYPVNVRVLALVGADKASVGENDIQRHDLVHGESEGARCVPEPAVREVTADANAGTRAVGEGAASLGVDGQREVSDAHAGSDHGDAGCLVDGDIVQVLEVDDEDAVAPACTEGPVRVAAGLGLHGDAVARGTDDAV